MTDLHQSLLLAPRSAMSILECRSKRLATGVALCRLCICHPFIPVQWTHRGLSSHSPVYKHPRNSQFRLALHPAAFDE